MKSKTGKTKKVVRHRATAPVSAKDVLDAAYNSFGAVDRSLDFDELRVKAGRGLVKIGAVIKALGETIEGRSPGESL